MEGKEGVKFDMGKPPLGLLPRVALEQEAQVLAFGAQKYGRDNWRLGMDHSRLLDACMRHVVAYADGEDNDQESGLSHLAHARCCLGFLLHYRAHCVGADDRPLGEMQNEVQPKMKKIKMMCWLDEYNCLCWTSSTARSTWVRIPQQDIEIEVPDDK